MSGGLKKLLPESTRDRYRGSWHRLKRRFVRPAFPQNPDGKVYVHLGCGKINHPKFVNVDALPLPHVHFIGGVERLPMFTDGSVDLVYSSHCLEHISHVDVPSVLQEWRRVLKPGGMIRLSVPDFDKILRIYADNECRIDAIEWPLLGEQNYQYNFHKSAFNRRRLSELLTAAGFKNVREWQPGSSDLTSLPDWSGKTVNVFDRKYPISLNLEAEKA